MGPRTGAARRQDPGRSVRDGRGEHAEIAARDGPEQAAGELPRGRVEFEPPRPLDRGTALEYWGADPGGAARAAWPVRWFRRVLGRWAAGRGGSPARSSPWRRSWRRGASCDAWPSSGNWTRAGRAGRRAAVSGRSGTRVARAGRPAGPPLRRGRAPARGADRPAGAGPPAAPARCSAAWPRGSSPIDARRRLLFANASADRAVRPRRRGGRPARPRADPQPPGPGGGRGDARRARAVPGRDHRWPSREVAARGRRRGSSPSTARPCPARRRPGRCWSSTT